MPDVLTFAQGQTATFTAQFVTSPAGMPISVSDATILILGQSASIVLAPTPMSNITPMGALPTGLYYYDYVIPMSMPVDIYTVLITGTVMGTPTAMNVYLQVLPAGSPTPASASQNAIGLVAALSDRYIDCFQKIPVKRELGVKDDTGTVVQFTWPRWNLANNAIRVNGAIAKSGITIDLDNGTATFAAPLHPTDRVEASYNWRWFTPNQLLGFVSDAIGQINVEPSQNIQFSVNNYPDNFVGVLMMGAAANAMRSAISCLSFQEEQTVFGGPEGVKIALDNFKTLKENYEKEFERDKKTLKTKGSYPKISAVVQPEYTLPGGRSRWFRYLFSNNVG